MSDWTPPPYLKNRASRQQPESPYGPRRSVEIIPPGDAGNQEALVTLQPQRLSLKEINFQRYSQIIPWKVVEYKLLPNALTPTSDVPMDWEFDEPQHDDDNEMRVYISLSPEDVAIIQRRGYQHYVIVKDAKVFEAADMAALEQLQQHEHEFTPNPAARAFLRLEHKQQLEWAGQQKYDLTILDFLAAPFRRNFENRYEVTQAQRGLNTKLSEFRNLLNRERQD